MPAPTVRTRFVLIQTSHAGNVGAVARAMRTMGFDDLVLVAPRWPDVLTMPEAIERASGADGYAPRLRHRDGAARFRPAHGQPARALCGFARAVDGD